MKSMNILLVLVGSVVATTFADKDAFANAKDSKDAAKGNAPIRVTASPVPSASSSKPDVAQDTPLAVQAKSSSGSSSSSGQPFAVDKTGKVPDFCANAKGDPTLEDICKGLDRKGGTPQNDSPRTRGEPEGANRGAGALGDAGTNGEVTGAGTAVADGPLGGLSGLLGQFGGGAMSPVPAAAAGTGVARTQPLGRPKAAKPLGGLNPNVLSQLQGLLGGTAGASGGGASPLAGLLGGGK